MVLQAGQCGAGGAMQGGQAGRCGRCGPSARSGNAPEPWLQVGTCMLGASNGSPPWPTATQCLAGISIPFQRIAMPCAPTAEGPSGAWQCAVRPGPIAQDMGALCTGRAGLQMFESSCVDSGAHAGHASISAMHGTAPGTLRGHSCGEADVAVAVGGWDTARTVHRWSHLAAAGTSIYRR